LRFKRSTSMEKIKEDKSKVGADRSSIQEIGNLSKVTSLLKRFESFRTVTPENAVKIETKPPTLPKKNYLRNSEMMRESAIKNQEDLAETVSSLPSVINVGKASQEVIYENVPIFSADKSM
jgi:hypothetical protein